MRLNLIQNSPQPGSQPSPLPSASQEDTAHLLHEIHNRQLEIELQGEELRRAERSIFLNSRRLTDFYDFAPVGYFTLTSSGQIWALNLKGADFLGRNRGQIIGSHFVDYIQHGDKALFTAHLQRLSEGPEKSECELQLISPTHQPSYVLLSSSLCFDEENLMTMIRTVVSDITQKRLLEAEVEKARAQAEQASQAKSQFLANMSHEIRTPLGVILGFSEVMLEEVSDDKNLSESVQAIRRNGEHLLNIINEILDLAKIESGCLPIEGLLFSVDNAIKEVVNLLRARANGKNLSLNFERADDAPDLLHTDPTRFRQILLNLVGNALKFTDRGGVTIKLRKLPSEWGAPLVTIDVSDSGCGIAEQNRDALFQAFSQVDLSTTRRYGGTGLGLVLSKKLAQAIGGDVILLASEPGKGSTFRLTLPQGLADTKVSKALPRAPAREELIGPMSLQGVKILLLSEALATSGELVPLLESHGAFVHAVPDSFDGVSKALTHCFDLLLFDSATPGLGAPDLIRLLRASHFEKPILAVLQEGDEVDPMSCQEAGYSGHIRRPFLAAEVVPEIVQQVRHHH